MTSDEAEYPFHGFDGIKEGNEDDCQIDDFKDTEYYDCIMTSDEDSTHEET